MVLIGEDAGIVNKISDVEVLVIDAAYFTKENIISLRNNNVRKIYSYLNIGSLENFRDYYEDYEKYTLGEYANWEEEKWVDVSKPEWKELILKQSSELAEKGIDGFFVDNVDVFYQYPNDDIYYGIIDILSGIKRTDLPIYLNGGESFIRRYLESEETEALFDGVNLECVYTSYDFENERCMKGTQNNITYHTKFLDLIKEKGYSVYVIEYSKDDYLTKCAYDYSKEHNYICYVSDNIGLLLCESDMKQ